MLIFFTLVLLEANNNTEKANVNTKIFFLKTQQPNEKKNIMSGKNIYLETILLEHRKPPKCTKVKNIYICTLISRCAKVISLTVSTDSPKQTVEQA